ncbi:MAG: antifreeze protein [Rhodobacteraceae bacterium]|jgi:hypothetical protein|nr:antifreeze protein [Paracoccaceae bacterium]
MSFDPFAQWRLSMELTRIGIASQTVIALRLAGMMGLWATQPSEVSRMIAEKPRVAAQSVAAATRAALAGEDAHKVMHAGLAPIRRRATANAARLTKLGPAGGR